MTVAPSVSVLGEPASATERLFIVTTIFFECSALLSSFTLSVKVKSAGCKSAMPVGAVNLTIPSLTSSKVTSGTPAVCSHSNESILPSGSYEELPSNVTRSPSNAFLLAPASATGI